MKGFSKEGVAIGGYLKSSRKNIGKSKVYVSGFNYYESSWIN
jgi:hypothetical protein